MVKVKVLQTAATIAKTTQTLIGEVIDTGDFDYITLFFDYVKGDETGVLVQAHYMTTETGTAYQDQSWDAAAGVKTVTANSLTATASGNHYATFDVRGILFVKFTQGGSNNDGTPTGTIAASYILK